jgi:hypothetical protein
MIQLVDELDERHPCVPRLTDILRFGVAAVGRTGLTVSVGMPVVLLTEA